MRRAGEAVSRSDILEGCWDMNFESESNLVEVYVASLRRKTEAGRRSRLIRTLRGTGYVLRANA